MDFAYTYDECGNITSEDRNGVVTSYGYDALGQLIRVNDPGDPTANDETIANGTTWVYEYDLGGNIQHKKWYHYTLDDTGDGPLCHPGCGFTARNTTLRSAPAPCPSAQ